MKNYGCSAVSGGQIFSDGVEPAGDVQTVLLFTDKLTCVRRLRRKRFFRFGDKARELVLMVDDCVRAGAADRHRHIRALKHDDIAAIAIHFDF